jgi:archaemetzincin
LQKKTIILASCGHFENEITEIIANHITNVFHLPVFQKRCTLDLSNFYNPGRRQYDANLILKVISEKVPEGYIKTVGLLRVDLYIPILTYIFGQAFLNGNTAIASLFRLRNELYGLKPDNNLLLDRFSKVVLHELGHTFGLIHCLDPVCIMRSSTYVEDLDQKEVHFCHSCREVFSKVIV